MINREENWTEFNLSPPTSSIPYLLQMQINLPDQAFATRLLGQLDFIKTPINTNSNSILNKQLGKLTRLIQTSISMICLCCMDHNPVGPFMVDLDDRWSSRFTSIRYVK